MACVAVSRNSKVSVGIIRERTVRSLVLRDELLELVVSITGRIVQRVYDAGHISENIEVRGGDRSEGIYRRGVSEQWFQVAAFASSCHHFLGPSGITVGRDRVRHSKTTRLFEVRDVSITIRSSLDGHDRTVAPFGDNIRDSMDTVCHK